MILTFAYLGESFSSSSPSLSRDMASMISSHNSALAFSSSSGSLSAHSFPIDRNGRLSPLCGSQSKLPRIVSSPAEICYFGIEKVYHVREFMPGLGVGSLLLAKLVHSLTTVFETSFSSFLRVKRPRRRGCVESK